MTCLKGMVPMIISVEICTFPPQFGSTENCKKKKERMNLNDNGAAPRFMHKQKKYSNKYLDFYFKGSFIQNSCVCERIDPHMSTTLQLQMLAKSANNTYRVRLH